MRMRWLALGLALALSTPGWAANKVYVTPEAPIYFGDAGQTPTPTAVITLTGLPLGTGRISAQVNRGTGAHAARYVWTCTFQLAGTNVPNEAIDVYIAVSDGTNQTGQLGTTDAAIPSGSSAKRNNLLQIGSVFVDQTTTATNMTGSGSFEIPSQFFSLVVWNGTTLNFVASTSVHKCNFIPWPYEVQ